MAQGVQIATELGWAGSYNINEGVKTMGTGITLGAAFTFMGQPVIGVAVGGYFIISGGVDVGLGFYQFYLIGNLVGPSR